MIVLLALAGGGFVQEPQAQSRFEGPRAAARYGAAAPGAVGAPAGGIGPDQAAAIARAQTGGRVLDVRRLPNGENSAYAVRLLLEPGRVRTVVVDGQSGRLR